MAATWARLVIALLVSAFLVAGCGGDKQQPAAGSSAAAPAATPTPTPVAVGGGGSIRPARPLSAIRAAARRFRKHVKERCESVGKAARVSASTASPDARKKEMTDEIAYLQALDGALDAVAKRPREPGTGALRRQLDEYRSRLRAQVALDRRIATAEDGYSVRVGINQNEKNRDARNDIVAEARFDDCLRARKPR